MHHDHELGEGLTATAMLALFVIFFGTYAGVQLLTSSRLIAVACGAAVLGLLVIGSHRDDAWLDAIGKSTLAICNHLTAPHARLSDGVAVDEHAAALIKTLADCAAACSEAIKPYSGTLVLLIFLACVGRANAVSPTIGGSNFTLGPTSYGLLDSGIAHCEHARVQPHNNTITTTTDAADTYMQGEIVVLTDRFPGSTHRSGGAHRPVDSSLCWDIIAFLYSTSGTWFLVSGLRIKRCAKTYGAKKRAKSRKAKKHRMLVIADSGATFGITKKSGKP